MARGEKPPEDTVVQVKPYPDLIWAWNAFWRLSAKRPQGFNGPLHIPDTEILARTQLERWDLVRIQDFLYYSELLDNAYMKHVAKVQQEDADRKQSNEIKRVPRRGHR